ncbi:unnamed protein product [Bursaphelenchus okinawaensis]|uniref:Uncharacterized protein n=1 Tax=Bursaphelenchus okinawaensis TaxID=465554 RepID=A0A811K3C8_9BILA|nr:unnamed protein product [Bursaphelenchus okinawaensis]CAG9089740.1 unnamed protein product [Bursaphelenchus okinawaensis]
MFPNSTLFNNKFYEKAGSLLKSAVIPFYTSLLSTAVQSLSLQPISFDFNYFWRDTVCVFVYVIVRTVNNIGVFDYGTVTKSIPSSEVKSLNKSSSIQALNIVDDNNHVVDQHLIELNITKSSRKVSEDYTVSSDDGFYSNHDEHNAEDSPDSTVNHCKINAFKIEEVIKKDTLGDSEAQEEELNNTGQNKLINCFTNKNYYGKMKRQLTLKKKKPHKQLNSQPVPKEVVQIESSERSQPSFPRKHKVCRSFWTKIIKVFSHNKVNDQPVYVKNESFVDAQ